MKIMEVQRSEVKWGEVVWIDMNGIEVKCCEVA